MSLNNRGGSSASTEDIMMVQESMKVAGLYNGQIDGLAGAQTYAAIRTYKKRMHMAPNNAITEEFIRHLRIHA